MIRAYDDNGNVIDLVKWKKQVRADAIDECITILSECGGGSIKILEIKNKLRALKEKIKKCET